jgi:hypothetical protein
VEVTQNNGAAGSTSAAGSGTSKGEIFKACVEKVMEFLNQKNER